MHKFTINYGKDNKSVCTSDDILSAINEACKAHGLNGLDDLHETRTGIFANILEDVGDNFIRDNGILTEYGFDNATPRYDIDKLKLMLELYIYLSLEYDKVLYLSTFQKLCGVSNRYIYTSSSSRSDDFDNRLNALWLHASKAIESADAERFADKANDSKQGLLNLAYGNYRHNWSGQIKSQEMATAVKTLEDIRQDRLTLEKSATDGQNPRFELNN